jgi:cation diffusion facilitator family transporter
MKATLTNQNVSNITFLSISLNIGLFFAKLTIAILINSVALLTDAFNHLSDSMGGFIFWMGQRLTLRKPDANHPQGHGRGEYLTSLSIAVLMLIVSSQFLIESIRRILQPSLITITPAALMVVLIGMAIKFLLYLYLKYLYRNTKLLSTKALAIDNLFDVVISLIVITSFLLNPWFDVPLDAYAGLVIAMIMAWTGLKLLLQSVRRVLGENLDPQEMKNIRKFLKVYPVILGTHNFIFHDYGPTYQMLSFHVEVSETQSFIKVHNIVDEIEERIRYQWGYDVMIHLDPMVENPIEKQEKIQPILNGLKKNNLSGYVINIRPIQENHHREMVIELKRIHDKQIIQDYLLRQFPKYRFAFDVIESEMANPLVK